MLKIAILCFGTTGKGGMETVISDVINELNKLGHPTELFLLGGSYDSSWLEHVRNRIVGKATDKKIFRYLKYTFILPAAIRTFRPDFIVGADERAVWTAAILKRVFRFKAPVASWMHFSITEVNHNLLKPADFHLAINSENVQQLLNLRIGTKENVYLINNPVKMTAITIPAPKDLAHFIYVGRLIYDGQKRVNDFITALSHLEGFWKATIIGEGADKAKLQALAKSLGIHSRIVWVGWKQDPWAEIDSASALVLTSEYEGFGMVLVEAMSRGIPCISSDCRTGPADIVQEGVNGWLYPVKDIAKLTTLLQKITDAPHLLPDANEIKNTIAHFHSDHVINNLIKTLEKLTRKSG